MEAFGIEAGKDPPKGVMRGDAIGQVEQLLQPRLFAFAKSSMSWNPSPPTMMDPSAMTMMSMRRCFLARSILGSGRSLKWETIDTSGMLSMALAPLMSHSL